MSNDEIEAMGKAFQARWDQTESLPPCDFDPLELAMLMRAAHAALSQSRAASASGDMRARASRVTALLGAECDVWVGEDGTDIIAAALAAEREAAFAKGYEKGVADARGGKWI